MGIPGLSGFEAELQVLMGIWEVYSAIEFLDMRAVRQGEFCSLILFATLGICILTSATSLIFIYLTLELLIIIS